MIDGPDKNFEAYMDEETGEYVYDAFNYTALAEDWKAYPMPLAVWDLGVAVYNIALPFLRGHSATVPPNACQLCAYYTLFGGAIQRHRDNFTTELHAWRKMTTTCSHFTSGLRRCRALSIRLLAAMI